MDPGSLLPPPRPAQIIRRATRRLLNAGRLEPAPSPPTQLHLSVTDRCFLPCVHCDIHHNQTTDLPTRTWLRAIDDLADWLGPVDANFVGGEPLMRRDLEILMARAGQRGFKVSFNTNGWLLTPRRARRLHEAGVSIAYISLDGIQAATVDATRGRRGAFRRAMAAIAHLEALPSPRVIVASILHGGNAAEIPELLAMVEARGHQLVVQPLFQNFGSNPYDPRWFRSSPLWPADPGPVLQALDVLMDARLRRGAVCNETAQLQAMKEYFRHPEAVDGRPCRAGYTDLALDPQGNYRLCFSLPPVGNLAEEVPPEKIWNRRGSLRRRWEISHCSRSCKLLNCNFSA